MQQQCDTALQRLRTELACAAGEAVRWRAQAEGYRSGLTQDASTAVDIQLGDLRKRCRRRELREDACAALALGAVAALVFGLAPPPARSDTLPGRAAAGAPSMSSGMIAKQGWTECRMLIW